MPNVRKVIIPVAGLGTRVLPASKAIPKEMMPVVDKPIIQYVVEEAIAAGITEIILVTRTGKSAIEDHFDSHFELEAELAHKNKTALLQSIQNIVPSGVTISSVRQAQAKGLGHAVYKCYVFVEPAELKADWNRDRIMSDINALGVPCFSGSCSEVYLEKAFDNTSFRPEERLLNAKKLGETSLMFLVHPTLTELEIGQTCKAIEQVMVVASL